MKTKPIVRQEAQIPDVRTILYNLINVYQPYPKLITEHKEAIDQAEQAIKALLLSKLPEKKYVSEDEDPAKAYDDLVHQGYNQAIEEITKIIKEI